MDFFPETKWTILAEATLNGSEVEKGFLSEICLKYKDPVDKIINLKGIPAERVEDVRQDFFLTLMKGSFFKKASQAKGKFRTFLLKALQDFLVDDFRRNSAKKRGGSIIHEAISETSAITDTDETEFDLVWAETLFNNALDHVLAIAIEKRGHEGWKALKPFFGLDSEEQDYDQLAAVLDLSVSGSKTEVARLRKKLREQLRVEVGLTVDAPHEIDEELRYLKESMIRVWNLKNV